MPEKPNPHKYRAMLHLLKDIGRSGDNEIAQSHELQRMKSGYLVYIHKAGVEHGYHHALAPIACRVQPNAVQAVYLVARNAVWMVLQGVPVLKFLTKRGPDRCFLVLGRRENELHVGDERQFFDPRHL